MRRTLNIPGKIWQGDMVNNFPKVHLSSERDNPFSCNVCDYRSKQISNMKTHEKIHLGEKAISFTDLC